MRRHYFIAVLISIAITVSITACAKKTDSDVAESETAATQTETQAPQKEIKIEEQTKAAVPEAGVSETTAPVPEQAEVPSQQLKPGAAASEKDVSETRTKEQPKEEKKTETPKVYSVTAFEDTMYAVSSVNVRAGYTTKSEVLTCLSPGEKVKVTGKSANGWMRVIYDGRDAYVYQKYLTENVPKRKSSASEPQKPEAVTPENEKPQTNVTTYPGAKSGDPVEEPGGIPIVAPAPVVNASGGGRMVSEYGPGVNMPGGSRSRSVNETPGQGPGI